MEETKTEVKETVKDASTETQAQAPAVKEAEDRAIPYARFKEKNDEAKELKRQLEMVKAEKEAAVNETAVKYQSYYESELAKVKRQAEEMQSPYSMPETQQTTPAYDNMIRTLESKLQHLESKQELVELNTSIEKLKTVYPSLSEEHVLAVKKINPKWDLQDCAEYSHQYFEGELKSRLQKMVDKQKQAERRPIMGEQGKVNLKPEERPKNFKDAREGFLKHMKIIGG